ncbi:MAG: FKBP-type peptidyl-prolyl cis-trans isomerase [Gammaproteobacteria bacterium]
MQVSHQKVVMIDYVLTDDDKNTLDKSDGQPLAYIHGMGNIIPGLEKALEGKAVGDKLDVRIEPAEAYGERSLEAIQTVPRDRFQGVDKIEAGMQFQAQGAGGAVQVVTVTNVTDTEVTVDANHPLAGVPLNFNVEVVGVRDAEAEEIEHGHVHGPGGHDH